MQEILGSVRRSLVFRTPNTAPDSDDTNTPLGGFINSCIRKSRAFSRPSPPPLPSTPPPLLKENDAMPKRWRKGELIGCGAFGRVYMGMNLHSGELLAVKQVFIAANSDSDEKTQAHIRELEEEVKLLKNLSHPNIVRYLGTVREEESFNILLEFVPGGSISSLLGKFGAFPEAVIRMYTKQLLFGLEYLHNNGIMHRDIKGANILVDNKGCIKLADFGASKKVVELATVSGAKSMKGTPYWMAPEVILQTGHNFSADIWSVGCTVIEMATGKPPWSQQYQEVAALFHIGTTKSHPPIPEHLSVEAKDFLLKCLQKEPNLRPAACELRQHPFVTGEHGESTPLVCTTVMEHTENPSPLCATNLETYKMLTHPDSTDANNLVSLSCSSVYLENNSKGEYMMTTNNREDDMCQIDDKDDLVVGEVKVSSILTPDDFNKSFNPMCEPRDSWRCKFDGCPELEQTRVSLKLDQPDYMPAGCYGVLGEGDNSGKPLSEDDDKLTESKIRGFLDEKALELKKLQTPLYEEFHNSIFAASSPNFVESMHGEAAPNYLKLPPKIRSPSCGPIGTPSAAVDCLLNSSPGSNGKTVSNTGSAGDQTVLDIPSSPLNDLKGLVVDDKQESNSPSTGFSERQRKWKEELDQELERQREMNRQAGQQTPSPKDQALNRKRERSRFASPGS